MRRVPDRFLTGPFSRAEWMDAELTSRVLEGSRFVRVFPGVYRHRDHVMTGDDWLHAAAMALPTGSQLTGITRIQQLGLDFGPRWPLHFVREGDVHPHIEGLFLHRTKRLAPYDVNGIGPAGAFISYCRTARVIDAIKVGDWLLHHQHTTIGELRDLALRDPWRDGAHEAVWILDHLDAASRSLPESELRALIAFSGLPAPEVNVRVPLAENIVVIADLYYDRWETLIEYEGSQHQDDRDQYTSDIDRYALLRRNGRRYVQVTREKLRHPTTLVLDVYRELQSAGYDGPRPEFGDHWRSLFLPIHRLLAQDRSIQRLSRRAVG